MSAVGNDIAALPSRFALSDVLGLVGALDHADIGILLLDAELHAVYMNQPFRDLWTIPDVLAARRPSFRDLVRHVETTHWRHVAPNQRRSYLRRRERAIRAGAVAPTPIELPDGRQVRFRCDTLPDGGRLLTYADVTDDIRRASESAVQRISAELRFATETLETQAAYLVALAEETEETRKQADTARLMLEREVEERRNIEAQLRQVATTDSLTGVLNRAAFLTCAERELIRARNNGKVLSILMLDADHFKTVNDRHGHAGGDAVLQYLAGACRTAMRAGDSIGRLGGEEFAVVLPGATLEMGEEVAERLRGQIASHAVWHGGVPIAFTVSVGVGAARCADQSIEQVMARADAALYAAKEAGRNRVVLERAA
ncbi:MAG TPA: diguanylate cyclase [Rhodopila sp.]|nr:diguanylate cyclase [Rhodopila sp.]